MALLFTVFSVVIAAIAAQAAETAPPPRGLLFGSTPAPQPWPTCETVEGFYMCDDEKYVKDAVSLCPETCTKCEFKSKNATSECRLEELPTIKEYSTPISEMTDAPAAARLIQVLTGACVTSLEEEKYMPCCKPYYEATTEGAWEIATSDERRGRMLQRHSLDPQYVMPNCNQTINCPCLDKSGMSPTLYEPEIWNWTRPDDYDSMDKMISGQIRFNSRYVASAQTKDNTACKQWQFVREDPDAPCDLIET